MSDASVLDATTTALVRFAIAVAGDRNGLDPAAADLAAVDPPAVWVDELLLQSVLMVGWPRALMAAGVWRRVSGQAAPSVDDGIGYEHHAAWTTRGEATCRIVYGANYAKLRDNVRALHPALDAWMVTEGYGRTLGRPGLDLVRRELCTVGQTAVLDAPHQFHSHVRGAVHAGASAADIDAVVQMTRPILAPERWDDLDRLWQEFRRTADAD